MSYMSIAGSVLLAAFTLQAQDHCPSGGKKKSSRAYQFRTPTSADRTNRLPYLTSEAGKDQSSAGGKVRTDDPEWAWVQ